MNRAKYFLTIFVGTLVYVLLSITVGQNSLRSFNMMEEQKRIISKQTSEIQNINSDLTLELTALQNDKTIIAAYARKLGYVSENEKIIKINGLKPAQNTLYDIGSVVRHEDPSFLPEKYCKMIGLFFTLLSFIVIFMFDLSCGNISFKKEKGTYVAGVPIYEVSQI